jgi:XTP/dITP diphosphohydrolase
MKLIFATNNDHKLKEISHLLGNNFQLLNLHDINCTEEIPEPFETIEENASAKAWYIFKKYGHNGFADDTGLEIQALNGAPGVYSARYAGKHKDFEANIQKVLSEMNGISNRRARFKTIISLVIDGNEKQFEGIVNGTIIYEKRGLEGFGYDPVFIPEGFTKTYAEMSLETKNHMSHRAIAFTKLVDYLKTIK